MYENSDKLVIINIEGLIEEMRFSGFGMEVVVRSGCDEK